jgi:hypothetical protein
MSWRGRRQRLVKVGDPHEQFVPLGAAAATPEDFFLFTETVSRHKRTMKAILSLLAIFLLSACVTTSTGSSAKSSGQKEIAIFQSEQPPTRPFTLIRTLKDDAGEDEEDEITEKFVKQARKLGGDAIVFREKKQSGLEVVPFGFGKIKYTFLYGVDVVRFE